MVDTRARTQTYSNTPTTSTTGSHGSQAPPALSVQQSLTQELPSVDDPSVAVSGQLMALLQQLSEQIQQQTVVFTQAISALQPQLPEQQSVVLEPLLASSAVATESRRHARERPKIAKYSGKDSAVRIEAWLNIFEVASHDRTGIERCYLLTEYLEGAAITWFAEEISPRLAARDPTLDWSCVKLLMENRFNEKKIRPILAARSRFLGHNENIQTYYDEKMRDLRQTRLEDIDIAAMLTDGMPGAYKSGLISAQIATPQTWLKVALELECHLKNRKPSGQFQGPHQRNNQQIPHYREATHGSEFTARSFTARSDSKKMQKKRPEKPPRPCDFCSKRGDTQWHWHSECPSKPTILRYEPQLATHDTPTAMIASGNENSDH